MTGFDVAGLPAPEEQAACPQCATIGGSADRFCESCGAALSEIRRVAIPRGRKALQDPEAPCSDCGNETHVDEYCTACGHRRAEPDRDEADLGGIVLITDRGLEHARNEDAAAAGMAVDSGTARRYAIAAVVCDGVSTSGEAHRAAVAASKAGVDAMLAALTASGKAHTAVVAGLGDAAKAAVAAGTDADASTAPSCTYTAVTVVPTPEGTVQITVGNVGDSRAYWLPEPPAPPQQLTVDDSLAQELITAGASADSEAVQRGAHTLTRWLGADAEPKPWSDSSVHAITVVGPGSLLLCSDGLWNYLPDAADIARFCTGTEPAAAANALVEYALRAGGNDNITVIVIPIGGAHEFA
jgi:serine/threonine protein phosphatase PrpC